MKNIKSIFYATNKDIYDLVYSSRKRIPNSSIVEILRNRKIIISENENRETLTEYFSEIPHDFYEREYLLEQTERGQRGEKIAHKEFNIEASQEDIKRALDSIKKKRTKDHREHYNSYIDSHNSFKVNIEYQEMDLTRTRLAQHREKEAEINIEINGPKLKLRGPANQIVDDILSDLKKELETIKNTKIEEDSISLAGIQDAEKRTKFFLNIIKGMSNFELDDVTALETNRLANEDGSEFDEENEVGDSENSELKVEVKRAVLSGRGLTFSPEFKRLSDSGFFISRIRWISKHKALFNKVEFEASLGSPILGTDFRYNVRGLYKYKPDATFTKTRIPLEESEKKEYLRSIENSAKLSLEKLKTDNPE